MAYFDPQRPENDEYESAFRQNEDDVYDSAEYDDLYDVDELYPDEDEMTEEELAEVRRGKWRVLAGAGDFLGVVVGTAVILILIALLVSLITWVQADISQSFTLWQTKL